MNLLLLAAGMLLAPQAAETDPPYFYCEVTRTVPFGNVTVLQYVNTAGPSEAPVTTWFAERGRGGTVLLASWHNRAEMEDSREGGRIYFGYQPGDRSRQYRMEVSPIGAAATDHDLRSELRTPSANGIVGLEARWGPLVAMLAGAVDLEVRVLDAQGAIVRRDRIDVAEFGRSLRIAGEIQPEFETMTAHYRERCHPTESSGR